MDQAKSFDRTKISRRAFVATAAAPLLFGQSDWKSGPGGLRTYVGSDGRATLQNFELEVEAMTRPGSRGSIRCRGFEVRLRNTIPTPGQQDDWRMTGSLVGRRDVYKPLVADDRWFTMRVTVRGRNVQVRLDSTLLVDYTDAASEGEGGDIARFDVHGTLALQTDAGARPVEIRRALVRPLPDAVEEPHATAWDDLTRKTIHALQRNIPVVDLHVHLKEGLTLEAALAKSRRDGVEYGLGVNCGLGFPVHDDASVEAFVASMAGQPVFVGMQGEGREWVQLASRRAAARFDYIFTDSMTWTDNRGKRMRLWIPEEVGTISDAEEFMDLLVERTVAILEREPVDIYANPTFLPDVIARDYDRLWTAKRMERVVNAAVKGGVAIELNDRRSLPSMNFIRVAKRAGCKFSFGTNNAGPGDLGRSAYGLRVMEELGLGREDFFLPGVWRPRAVDRKGDVLRAG